MPRLFKAARDRVSFSHARTPFLRKLPLPALAIIVLLVLVNILVWGAAGIVLVRVFFVPLLFLALDLIFDFLYEVLNGS